MKVCLVFPRFRYVSGDPPLGLAYIAAYLQAHTKAKVSILDTTFHRSFDYVRRSLVEIEPDLVGIYCDTLMYRDALEVARIARFLGIKTVAGGPHATVAPESLKDAVDGVVLGEGEMVMRDIVNDLEELDPWREPRVFKSITRPRLDDLPFPALELLDMKRYIQGWHYLDDVDPNLRGTNIIASRGCDYGCTYCQPTLHRLFGKMRHRRASNVVDEIQRLQWQYEINAIFLHDDTFTADSSWVYVFCDELERQHLKIRWSCNTRADTIDETMIKRMKEVGLTNIHLGIESGSQRILDDIYHKRIRLEQVEALIALAQKHRVGVLGFFMLGAPAETLEETNQTIKLACRLPLKEATFSIFTPLPGTKLHAMGSLSIFTPLLSNNWADYDYYRGGVRPGDLKRLRRLQYKAFLLFYLHPRRWRFLLRQLTSRSGIRKAWRKIRRYA